LTSADWSTVMVLAGLQTLGLVLQLAETFGRTSTVPGIALRPLGSPHRSAFPKSTTQPHISSSTSRKHTTRGSVWPRSRPEPSPHAMCG
jgi:hypothetical protein